MIDLDAVTTVFKSVAEKATGRTFIPSDQNAPREIERPYGTIDVMSDDGIGEPELGDIELVSSDISGVDQVNKKFTLSDDVSSKLSPGANVLVSGSTGNDGPYTVKSVATVGGSTVVEVEETIPDPAADGSLSFGWRQVLDQTELTVSFVVYGHQDPSAVNQPRQLLVNLKSYLNTLAAQQEISDAGLAVRDDLGVQKASAEFRDVLEPRATLDLLVGAVSIAAENVDILEQVDVTADLEKPDGSEGPEVTETIGAGG